MIDREPEGYIEEVSNSVDSILKDRTGTGILETLENAKEEGRKITRKAGKAGKVGAVTTAILGMVMTGAPATDTAEAYKGETGNLADPLSVTERSHRADISFFDLDFKNFYIDGGLHIGREPERSDLLEDSYRTASTRETDIEIFGTEKGAPYIHLEKKSSEIESEFGNSYSIDLKEKESVTEMAAGITLGNLGLDRFYGFLKNITETNELRTGYPEYRHIIQEEYTGVYGAGLELIRALDEGAVSVRGEIGVSDEKQGVKGQAVYRNGDLIAEIGLDQSIENQELEDDNIYSVKLGYELGEGSPVIKPYVELGDRFDRYGVRTEAGWGKRLDLEAGMKRFEKDGETGLYIEAGTSF